MSIFFDSRAAAIGFMSSSGKDLSLRGNFAISVRDCSSRVLPSVMTRSVRASFDRFSGVGVGVFVSASPVFHVFAVGGVGGATSRSQSALIFAKKEFRGLSPLSKSL